MNIRFPLAGVVMLAAGAGAFGAESTNEIRFSGAASPPAEPLSLWYLRPAATWEDALPVGNGRLGAMVFGGLPEERIQLNEISIWAGPPVPEPRKGTAPVLEQARRLFFDGNYVEGEDLVRRQLLSSDVPAPSYQPLGELRLNWDTPAEIRHYRRDLNLDQGVATTRYEADGVAYTREVFASRANDVIVIHISAAKPREDLRTVVPRQARRQNVRCRRRDARAVGPGRTRYREQRGEV
jgi:hypothetical protein